MSVLRTYLKFRMRALIRTWGEEWATYFILAPVMLGALFLLGRRVFHDFADKIGKVDPTTLSNPELLQSVLAVLSLKVFFNFLPLSKRLYPIEQALTIDDLLPIHSEMRYLMFYIEQLIRDIPFFLFGLFLILFVDKPGMVGWVFTFWLFFPGMEIGLTMLWNHLHPPSRPELALALFFLLWLIWFLPVESMGWWIDFVAPFLVTAGFWGFGRWRYQDVSRVEQLLIESQQKGGSFKWIGRSIPASVRPLLLRDFRLTLRNFAPLFWRNLAIALLLIAAVAFRGNIPAAVFCAAATYFLAATASTLFALQRPYREIDFILPLPVERIWRGKVLYAVYLSLPIPWLVWGLEMVLRPLPPSQALPLLLQLVLVGLAVAALTGGTICEGDQKPALHYIIAGFLSLLATLFIAVFHPLLFVLVFPVLGNLRGSAITRLEDEEAA